MRRYPAYRDSGVEWLGEVPAGWEVKRLRLAARLNPSAGEIATRPLDEEVTFLPMEAVGEDGSIRLDQTRAIGAVSSGYTYFRNGDVAVAKITPCFENGKRALMRGLVGGIGYGTTELTVMRPREDAITSEFLFWLVSAPWFRWLGEAEMTGAGGQKWVPDSFVCDLCIPLPSLPEQQAIAAFLDRETAKIDALVAEQRRLVELLREKRQAVISHAVTRGLDPTARLKPSGVDWLGEVPEGWGVVPLKHLVSFVSGGTPSKDNLDFWDGDIPWASAKDLKVENLWDTELHVTEHAVDTGAAGLVEEGAVIVLVRGMTLAKSFPVCLARAPMAINQDLKALLCSERLRPEFLAWMLRGLADESLGRVDEAGHGTKALRMDAWAGMEIVVPPLPEQQAIAEFLDRETAKIEALMNEAESAIALLQERRAALVSAAVTGRIDVREAAAPREAAVA